MFFHLISDPKHNFTTMRGHNASLALLRNFTDKLNLTKTRSSAWYEDDGSMEWLFVCSFIWALFASIFGFVLFSCNRKLRHNRSSLLSLTLLVSVLINEIFMSVTLIYHDAIGIPRHWTFGVDYCRFVILAQTFSVSLQSFTILLVTVDSWFQGFSPAKYNDHLASKRIFIGLLVSPWIFTILGILVITLPVSPEVGRLMTYKNHTFCFLDIKRGVYRVWVTAFVVYNFLLPALASFLLSCALVFMLCRRLSTYQSFSGDAGQSAMMTSSNPNHAESRIKHVIVSTFIMNILFICLSGPFVWSRLTKDYSIYRESRIVFRIYWCLLPVIWLMLQPELVAMVTSTFRKCWRLGPRAAILSFRSGGEDEGSRIREYNVSKSEGVENGTVQL